MSNKGEIKLKAGEKIRYKEKEEDEFQDAIVVSRAGKVKGKDRNQYNVVLPDDRIVHVHLDQVVAEKAEESEMSNETTYYLDDKSEIFTVTVPKSRNMEPPKDKELSNADSRILDKVLMSGRHAIV